MRGSRWGRPIAVLVVCGLAGCSDTEDAPDAPEAVGVSSEPTVEEMGALGARIHAEPERAEEIVAEADLTPAEFEARVRAITDDPEESARYARAFEDAAAGVDRSEGGG